jgi:hypothetical protein
VTVTPTAAEAEAINYACGLHLEPGVSVDVPDKLITDAIDDLKRKTRWPGTKSFDHEAAYRAELLTRVAARSVQ